MSTLFPIGFWKLLNQAPLLGDSVFAASGAYPTLMFSTRKLVAGYTGFCMTVRRGSDNQSFHIGFKSDGTINDAALASIGAGTDLFVSIFYNQSPNAPIALQRLVQTDTARQPRVVIGGAVQRTEKALVTIKFSGAASTVLSLTSNFDAVDIFLTAQPRGDNGSAYIKTGTVGIGIGQGNTEFDNNGFKLLGLREIVAWQPTTATLQDNTSATLSMYSTGIGNGRSLRITYNTALVLDTNNQIQGPQEYFAVGGYQPLGGLRFTDAAIAEVIAYAGNYDSTARTLIVNNQYSYYTL